MKVFVFIICIMFFVSVVCAKDLVQQPKERCNPNDFVIMPWGSWASEGPLVDYNHFYKDIYDCGFNVAGFMPEETIPLAKKNHVMVSLNADNLLDNSIENIDERSEKWANEIKKKLGKDKIDNVFQVYVKDEPWKDALPEVKAKSKAIKDILGLRPYVNLLPNFIFGDTYRNYCETFINECGLDYISYDNYAFTIQEGFKEDQFYSNLEEVSQIAREKNLWFTNIILSVGHFNYMVPNDFTIHVQGWSTLAYGARGLSYFTFHNPKLGNYRHSAYDNYGNKTDVWHSIQDMNYSIHNIMPYYKNLKNINVFHIGNIPSLARGIESAKVIDKIDANVDNRIKPNLVVGEFLDKEGKEYAIIVNKDPVLSVNIPTVEFKKGKKIRHIYSVCCEKNETDWVGEDCWIAPGYGVLLRGDK